MRAFDWELRLLVLRTPSREARPVAQRILCAGALIVSAWIAASCSSPQSTAATPTQAQAAPQPTAQTPAAGAAAATKPTRIPLAQVTGEPPVVGNPAPDFTADLLGGGTFKLAEQQGKPVLVLFTASWCTPCIAEVNKMAPLQDQYGAQGLQQLALSIQPGDTAQDFTGLRDKTNGQKLSWGLDAGQKATLAYKVTATDTKVLVDRRGVITWRAVGATPAETLQQQIAAVMP